MNSVWIEHRARFFYQIFAVTILGVFVFMDILFEMTSKESFLNITQSISYMLQSCSILIFLLARQPHDCLHCFNRVQHISYSQFTSTTAETLTTQNKQSVGPSAEFVIKLAGSSIDLSAESSYQIRTTTLQNSDDYEEEDSSQWEICHLKDELSKSVNLVSKNNLMVSQNNLIGSCD